jgi:hypothetical protein
MTRTPARWAAGGLLVLTVAALAASAGFGVATGDLMDAFAFVPVLLAFAGVGAVVASRRPGNPIGWLFLAQGLGAALGLAGLTYAKYGVRSGAPPGAARWAAGVAVFFIEAFFSLFLILLLYPDGRLPSRRWRPAVWLILAANALLLAVAATSDVAFEGAAPAGLAAPVTLIPHRIAGPLVSDLEVVMLFLFLLSAAAWCGTAGPAESSASRSSGSPTRASSLPWDSWPPPRCPASPSSRSSCLSRSSRSRPGSPS